MEPGDRQPAPEPLRLVQQFVNTRDVMERTDRLESPAALLDWAVARELLDENDEVTAEDHRRALEVREALRALLLQHNGAAIHAEAGVKLDDAAQAAGVTLRFDATTNLPQIVAQGSGIDRLLGTVLLAIYEASRSERWRRLKACREPTCQWAFYDHSRNSRSHWCTMSMCGGRAKARTYRQRKRGGTSAAQARLAS